MMNLFKLPGKLFTDYGGRLAIFLVKRRVKKTPKNPALWLMLAKLYYVRQAKLEAVQVLKSGLKVCPGNPLLRNYLDQIKGVKASKPQESA